jgi:hypothetical protein
MDTDVDCCAGPSKDEEHELPCAEGLLAASLALMTGYADPQACPRHKPLLARKVAETLATLCDHPLLNPNFRAVLWGLSQRWQQRCEAESREGAATASSHRSETAVPMPWVKAPARLQ